MENDANKVYALVLTRENDDFGAKKSLFYVIELQGNR